MMLSRRPFPSVVYRHFHRFEFARRQERGDGLRGQRTWRRSVNLRKLRTVQTVLVANFGCVESFLTSGPLAGCLRRVSSRGGIQVGLSHANQTVIIQLADPGTAGAQAGHSCA